MNLEELIDETGLQQDNWTLSKPIFGDEGQLEVIGWSGRSYSNKIYISFCSKCSKDIELFGQGYFKSLKNNLVNLKQMPCGCSKNTQWSKKQYAILCSRKASSLGFEFIDFIGEWSAHKTKIRMFCEKHGEWSTGSISELINKSAGCPRCGIQVIVQHRTKPDEEMITSFFASGSFHPNTKFWRNSDRSDNLGRRIYWSVLCPECNQYGESTSGHLQKGQRPCACSPMRQKEAYINFIKNKQVDIALKFGIAINSDHRIKRQNRKSIYDVEKYVVYIFPDLSSCRKAERECLEELQCGVVSKKDMPDGWTETTWIYNLDKIIEIYERNGGVLKTG